MASQSGGSNGPQAGTYPTWPDGSIDQQIGGMLNAAGYMRQVDSSGLNNCNLSSHTTFQPHLHDAGHGEESHMERSSETGQFFLSGFGTYLYNVNSTSDSIAAAPAMAPVGARDMAHDPLLADTNQVQDRSGNMSTVNPYRLMSSFNRLQDSSALQQQHAQAQDTGGSDQLAVSQSGMDGRGFGAPDVATAATTQQFLYARSGMGGGAMAGYSGDEQEAAEDAAGHGFGSDDTPFRFMSGQQAIMSGQSGVVISEVTAAEDENDGTRGHGGGGRRPDWGDASDPASVLKVADSLYDLREHRRREEHSSLTRAFRRPTAFTQRAALETQQEHSDLGMGGSSLAREYATTAVREYNDDPFSQAAVAAAGLLEQSFAGSRHSLHGHGASSADHDIRGMPADQTYSNQVTPGEDMQNGDPSGYNVRPGPSSWNTLLPGAHSAGQYGGGLYDGSTPSFYNVSATAPEGGYSGVPDHQLSAFASDTVVPSTSPQALHGYLSRSDTQMQLYLSGYAGGAYADASGNASVLGVASGGNPDLGQGQSGAQFTYFNSALSESAIASSNAAVQHLSSSLEGTSSHHHLALATNTQAAAPQYPYSWRHESNELAFFPSSLEAEQESQGMSHYQQQQSVADHMSQYEQFQQRAAAAASLSQQSAQGLHNSGGHGLLNSMGAAEGDMGALGSGQSLSLSLFSQNTSLQDHGARAPHHLPRVQTDVMSLAAAAEARLGLQDPGSTANTLSLGRFRPRHPPPPQGQHLVFRPLDTNPASVPLQNRFMAFRGIYAKSGQDLLLEICSPAGRDPSNTKNGAPAGREENKAGPASGNEEEAGPSQPPPGLTPDQRAQVQARKTRLISMIGEVDGQYRTYVEHMKVVMVTIDTVMGKSSSLPYTKLALNAMSRHFRVLRDAIEGQLRVCNRLLGEPNTPTDPASRGELPRLKYLDAQLRQQKALQHLGMIQQHAWRPQRGLPEKAVILLRAWLFEHFLHPYPKDSDKITLAKKTGLTRSQVSNWFINARVRLWKPMVEEMYMEESRDEEAQSGRHKPPSSEAGDGSVEASMVASSAGAALAEAASTANEGPPVDEARVEGGEWTGGRGPDEEELARLGKKRRGTGAASLAPAHAQSPQSLEAPVAAQSAAFAGAGYITYHPGAGGGGVGRFVGSGATGVSLTLGLRHADNFGAPRFQMVLDAARSEAGAAMTEDDAGLGRYVG